MLAGFRNGAGSVDFAERSRQAALQSRRPHRARRGVFQNAFAGERKHFAVELVARLTLGDAPEQEAQQAASGEQDQDKQDAAAAAFPPGRQDLLACFAGEYPQRERVEFLHHGHAPVPIERFEFGEQLLHSGTVTKIVTGLQANRLANDLIQMRQAQQYSMVKVHQGKDGGGRGVQGTVKAAEVGIKIQGGDDDAGKTAVGMGEASRQLEAKLPLGAAAPYLRHHHAGGLVAAAVAQGAEIGALGHCRIRGLAAGGNDLPFGVAERQTGHAGCAGLMPRQDGDHLLLTGRRQ